MKGGCKTVRKRVTEGKSVGWGDDFTHAAETD